MKNLANFLLFQMGWFACVRFAVEGKVWPGVAVTGVIVAVHLAAIARPEQLRREALYILIVGFVGTLLDAGLASFGATLYPTTELVWPSVHPPPWITALWILFATLPHHSLGWLAPKPRLAVLLGAIGGPLSYYGGVRMGAVGIADPPLLTWGALALEYAIVTPLLLRYARFDSGELGDQSVDDLAQAP